MVKLVIGFPSFSEGEKSAWEWSGGNVAVVYNQNESENINLWRPRVIPFR